MRKSLLLAAICILSFSCSTTRVLEDGQYRLEENTVTVSGDPEFNSSEISNYIRQGDESGGLLGFNPFIYVYNWSRKDGLFHKLGTPPIVYDEAAAGTSITNISNRLKYLGYYDSKVDTATVRHGKKIRVNYIVNLGERYRIEDIVFEVPEYEPFAIDFYADTATVSKALRGAFLSEQMLEQETVRSAARLRNMGYYSLSRNNYSFEADTLGGHTLLKYRIREFERSQTEASAVPLNKYTIGKVSITLPEDLKFRKSVLEGLNTVKPGSVYSENTVAATYNRLSALKLFSGVAVEMTQADSSTVDCSINLTRSPMQGFKINLEGSSNSSGLMGISPQLSYFHKNIFHGGEWLTLGFNGDFQFKLNDDTRATEYGISAGVSFPRFLGLPYSMFRRPVIPRTEFNVAFNHQNRPEYTRNIVSINYGYSGTARHNISYQLYPLQVNFVKLYGLDAAFSKTLSNNPYMRYSYQDHLDAGIGAVLYFNSSSEIVPKGNYHFRRLSLDLSGNVLSLFNRWMGMNDDGSYCIGGSPYAQYIRGEYSFGRTWRFGSKDGNAIATRFLAGAGYAYGNSSALPFEKQFYAGGASSMRGWQARAVGPGFSVMNDAFIIPSQTGDMKLEANLEYRFKVFWKLEGALFTDIGNVWNLKEIPSDFLASLAADWGTGVRLNLDFILLRIDFGMKVYDPSRNAGERFLNPGRWLRRGGNAFHFGIGYPF